MVTHPNSLSTDSGSVRFTTASTGPNISFPINTTPGYNALPNYASFRFCHSRFFARCVIRATPTKTSHWTVVTILGEPNLFCSALLTSSGVFHTKTLLRRSLYTCCQQRHYVLNIFFVHLFCVSLCASAINVCVRIRENCFFGDPRRIFYALFEFGNKRNHLRLLHVADVRQSFGRWIRHAGRSTHKGRMNPESNGAFLSRHRRAWEFVRRRAEQGRPTASVTPTEHFDRVITGAIDARHAEAQIIERKSRLHQRSQCYFFFLWNFVVRILNVRRKYFFRAQVNQQHLPVVHAIFVQWWGHGGSSHAKLSPLV